MAEEEEKVKNAGVDTTAEDEKEEAIENEMKAMQTELDAIWEQQSKMKRGDRQSVVALRLEEAAEELKTALKEEVTEAVVKERLEVVRKNVESLERDVERMEEEEKALLGKIKKEEGKKEAMEAAVRECKEAMEKEAEEIRNEYAQMSIACELDIGGYYEALQWVLERAGGGVTVGVESGCDGQMTIGLLTALSKHYEVIQLQARLAKLQPQITDAAVFVQVGESGGCDAQHQTNTLKAKKMVIAVSKKKLAELRPLWEKLEAFRRLSEETKGLGKEKKDELETRRKELMEAMRGKKSELTALRQQRGEAKRQREMALQALQKHIFQLRENVSEWRGCDDKIMRADEANMKSQHIIETVIEHQQASAGLQEELRTLRQTLATLREKQQSELNAEPSAEYKELQSQLAEAQNRVVERMEVV